MFLYIANLCSREKVLLKVSFSCLLSIGYILAHINVPWMYFGSTVWEIWTLWYLQARIFGVGTVRPLLSIWSEVAKLLSLLFYTKLIAFLAKHMFNRIIGNRRAVMKIQFCAVIKFPIEDIPSKSVTLLQHLLVSFLEIDSHLMSTLPTIGSQYDLLSNGAFCLLKE